MGRLRKQVSCRSGRVRHWVADVYLLLGHSSVLLRNTGDCIGPQLGYTIPTEYLNVSLCILLVIYLLNTVPKAHRPLNNSCQRFHEGATDTPRPPSYLRRSLPSHLHPSSIPRPSCCFHL